MSLRRLGVDSIDLFQLHRIDDKFPSRTSSASSSPFSRRARSAIGLSEVNVDQLRAAQKTANVVSVQNMYNLTCVAPDRCSTRASPTASPSSPGSPSPRGRSRARRPAGRHRRRPSSQRGPAGVGLAAQAVARDAADPRHVEGGARRENIAAAGIEISDEEFDTLSSAASSS
jgi:aryl-alcohol dehydrogenase-like predicted oxidoreductase